MFKVTDVITFYQKKKKKKHIVSKIANKKISGE